MPPRRVIFLDIDGVLNRRGWRSERIDEQWSDIEPELRIARFLDPAAVARLNRLIGWASAEVVLSSSWRVGYEVAQMQRILEVVGFEGRIVDRTPRPDEHDPAVYRRYNGSEPPSDRTLPRGYEIQQWLDRQKDVGGIVILDDSTRMAHLAPWLVWVNAVSGLQDEHIADALVCLERPGPAGQ